MDLGILGWPGAGKTTLFTALTGRQFASHQSAETHTSVVKVPDPRVDRLSEICKPQKTTYAEVTFIDAAGERGPATDRPSFPETLLAAVRDVDALALVVRAFEDPHLPRPPGSTTPKADLLALEQELILGDLGRVEKRLQRLQKEGNRPEAAAERAVLERSLQLLDAETPLRAAEWSETELSLMRGFQFLSLKPAMVVLNISEADLGDDPPESASAQGLPSLRLSARVESELVELEPSDQIEFLQQLGLQSPARDVFIRSAYELLDLISFFTVGEDEVRAWAVRRDSAAPVAAGKIHSDLQKGFIRAEVIHYDDFVQLGSMAAAKSKGLLRLEGKNYPVQDGDIMHVRHA